MSAGNEVEDLKAKKISLIGDAVAICIIVSYIGAFDAPSILYGDSLGLRTWSRVRYLSQKILTRFQFLPMMRKLLPGRIKAPSRPDIT